MGDCLIKSNPIITETILNASKTDSNNGWRYIYSQPTAIDYPIINPVIHYGETITNNDSYAQGYENSGIDGYTNGAWVSIADFGRMVVQATSSSSRSGNITITDNVPYTCIRGRSYGKHKLVISTYVTSYQVQNKMLKVSE